MNDWVRYRRTGKNLAENNSCKKKEKSADDTGNNLAEKERNFDSIGGQ